MEFPSDIAPMLPVAARELPHDEERWAWEVKFDGFRALLHCQGGELRILSRNLRPMTFAFPELAPLARALGRECVLDGEIVAFGPDGRPDFERMQSRTGFFPESRARRRLRGPAYPVSFQAFDIMLLDGRRLMRLPYLERRAMLEELNLAGDFWMVPSVHVGRGAREILAATRSAGLEGLVAKRLESPYQPGRRSPDWLKIKNWQRQEFVVCGYRLDQEGSGGWLGGLLLGCYAEQGLSYCGLVEAGFNPETVDALRSVVPRLQRAGTPLRDRAPDRREVYLDPVLVCEVQFLDWTSGGRIRQAAFRGFALDKQACDVRRESYR